MSNLCKPVYIVNALPKLRFFTSETETYDFRNQWTTNRSLWSSFFSLQALPQHGIVLETLPGKKFSQWDEIPFSGNGTLRSYCLRALLQIQEGRCGTTGSCWRAYLHLYLTLPWIWNESLFSLEDLPTFLEPQTSSFERLFQRNLYENNFVVHRCLTSLSTGCCSASEGFSET